MDAERAWQSALGQLQLEMPKASFDTWVRDARLVRFGEGLATIGVRNAYARDWLESRLSSTLTRLLTGITNQDVEVQFVVHAGDDLSEEDQRAEAGREEGRSTEKELDVEAVWESAYEQVVMPERAVALNAYFLRHLRLLGPDLGWLYIGFRQAAYNAGGRSGRKSARFCGKQIAAMSGATERTFWNRVKREETWARLAGLVTPIAVDVKEWAAGPTLRRLPRRYSVAMTLPLTAADVHSLTTWIAGHIEQHGGPEGTLAAASETPVETLIPPDAPTPEDSRPQTVRQIVRDLFMGTLTDEKLDALAERMQMHLMPPGDLLVITHFFIAHILPWLGTGPGWMLTILRDRCFVDAESGSARNQVTVRGGYAEIAGWIGIARPKTIWEWLRDPIVQIYLRCGRSGLGEESKWEAARRFDVLLEEVPAEIVQAALAQGEWRGFQYRNGAVFSIGVARFSEDSGAVFSIAVARISEFGGAIFRVFKLLSSLNQALNSKTPPPPTPSSQTTPQEKPVVVVPSSWDLQTILAANCQDAKLRKHILDDGGTPQALISWLLYTFSRQGGGLHPGINYALSKLKENPETGAGGAFDRLAALPPTELVRLITRSTDKARGRTKYADMFEEKSDLELLWDDAMANSSEQLMLLKILLGKVDDMPYTEIRIEERTYQGVTTKVTEVTRCE